MTTPPIPPGPPPGLPPPPSGFAANANAWLGMITALLISAGAFGAVISGGVESFVDWMNSADQTTSKISAIDERVRIMENSDKERLAATERDRAEAVKMAREIEKRIDEANRTGLNVDDLVRRLRDVELRQERLTVQIDFLKDRRR